MPWMVCKADHRYYAKPSEMDTAPCPKCVPTVQWASVGDLTSWKPDQTSGSAALPDGIDPKGVLSEDGT